MNKDFDLLVAGELNPDLILSSPNLEPRFGQVETLIDDASLTIGSSSAIFACGIARLGMKVAFIGVVGRDVFGSFMLDSLIANGIDVSNVITDDNQRTGLSVLLNRQDDRAILTYPGTIPALRGEQVSDALLGRTRHLHVASYFLQTGLKPGLSELFRRARRQGASISLDPNWDPDEKWSGVLELLPLIDVLLPNQAEAQALTHSSTLEKAIIDLAAQVPILAVKMGHEGGLAYQGDYLVQVPALFLNVVDTIGAGDSFDAGFIYGYLKGWNLERCLKLGVTCGSLSTRGRGGTQKQPTLFEATLNFYPQ
jgi:sugar/nucleoside kinase (ribokinase family)